MNAALIKDNIVVNMILLPNDWTGQPGQWQPDAGQQVILNPEKVGAKPGYIFDAQTGGYVAPAPLPPKPDPNAPIKTAIDAVLADPLIDQKLKAVFTEMRKGV